MYMVTNNVLKNITNMQASILKEAQRGFDKVQAIEAGERPGNVIAVTQHVLKNVVGMQHSIMRDANRALDKVQDIGAGPWVEPPPMWTDADDYPENDCDCVMLVDGKIVLGVYVMGTFYGPKTTVVAPTHYFIIPGVEDAV
jgi:hypothetical protein